jgi:hypothetical protein
MLAVLVSVALTPAHLAAHVGDYRPSQDWSSAMVQAALRELGWSASSIVWFEYLRGFWLYLAFLGAGLLILWRKSNDWFGLYLGFVFAFVPALTMLGPLVPLVPSLGVARDIGSATSWQFFFVAFYVFPSGAFVPRWTRWLVPVWVGLCIVSIAFEYAWQGATPGWVTPAYLGLVLIAVASQVYRYFWSSNAVERQQTKWVVVSLAILVASMLAVFGSASTVPTDGTLGIALVLHLAQLVIVNLIFGLVPVFIAIAILRYRLWDIDVIIRRTLIYSVLSALLVLAYLGSVLVLQPLLTGLTGQGSVLATVLSTLLIAALAAPLRRWVQGAIDKRFYRRKYDAARTLAAFGAQARDETDLGRLSERLREVVEATMQPESVGLWLKGKG